LRELAAVSALAALLINRGLKVRIAHLYHDWEAYRQLRPRIVAFPFFYGDTDPTLKRIFNNFNGPIINLAWEQIYYGIQKQVKEPRNIALSDRVTHCCWSADFADMLTRCGVRTDRIAFVGNPSFGLMREPYVLIEPKREQLASSFGLQLNKQWVLFTENYRWAFLTESQLKRFASWGGNRKSIDEAVAYCRTALRSLVLELNRLAETDFFERNEFVFRLRPASRHDQLERFLREEHLSLPAQVVVNKEYNARAWILASNIVVSSFSTTICDAALAGKQILVYSPIPFPEDLKYDWTKLVTTVDVLDERTLQDRFAGEPTRLRDYVEGRYLSFGDPIDNLATLFAHIGAQAGADNTPSAAMGRLRDITRFEAGRIGKRVVYPFLRRRKDLDKKLRITPYLDDLITIFSERRMVNGWRRILGL
jgi:surface carbohydrate biosynthesis protein